jgi:type IV pilus assembly protein PilX
MKKQKGAALIVSLVLLTLVALLGVAGVQTIGLEEKMAGHSFDRNLAFQAAEAALREAEARIPALRATLGAIPDDLPAAQYTDTTCQFSSCQAGVCARPDPVCHERWSDPNFTGWVNATPVTAGNLSITPQYFIEVASRATPCETNVIVQDLQGTCTSFRVTARTTPQEGRAQVMLQSVFVWPN